MFYVYEHICVATGQCFYVGKGKNNRAYSKHRSQKWHNYVKKYGEYIVKFLVKDVEEEFAFLIEEETIDTYKKRGYNLVNLTNGGDGVSGLKHNDSTKKVLKQHSLNNGSVERCKWMANDPEIKQKRIIATTGKKRTEYSKARMSEAKDYKKRGFEVCGIWFDSITQFAKLTNKYQTSIRRILNRGDFKVLEEIYRAKVA